MVGNKFALSHIHGRDVSFGIGTRYGLDGPGIESRCWRDFLCHSGQSRDPTSLQKIGMGSFPWMKRSQPEADHPPPSTAMLRIGRSYIHCVGLTTLPLSCGKSLEILEASCSQSPRGMSSPVMGYVYPFSTNYVLFGHCINLYPSNSLASLSKVFCG
jgi:hypothetical protein